MPVQIAKRARVVPEEEPTADDLKTIEDARRNRATDKYITIDELRKQRGL